MKSTNKTPHIGYDDADGEMLKLRDVAAHFRVCTKTIRRLIVLREIPVVRVGRQIRIPARFLSLFATKKWGQP